MKLLKNMNKWYTAQKNKIEKIFFPTYFFAKFKIIV